MSILTRLQVQLLDAITFIGYPNNYGNDILEETTIEVKDLKLF